MEAHGRLSGGPGRMAMIEMEIDDKTLSEALSIRNPATDSSTWRRVVPTLRSIKSQMPATPAVTDHRLAVP